MGFHFRRFSRREFLILALAGAGSGAALWLASQSAGRNSTSDANPTAPATESPTPLPATQLPPQTPATTFSTWGQDDITFDQLNMAFDRL